MQTLINLMKADSFIVFKNKTRSIVLFSAIVLLFIVASIALDPAFFAVFLVIFITFFPGMTWQNFGKAKMMTMHGILPVQRRHIVRARYLMMALIHTAVSALSIIGTALSCLIRKRLNEMSSSMGLHDLSEIFNMDLSDFGFYLLYLALVTMIGYLTFAVGLRSGFRDGFQGYQISFKKRSKNEKKKNRKKQKESMIVLIVLFGIYFLFALLIGLSHQITFFGKVTSMIMALISAFIPVANGWLISLMMILTGIGYMCYQCVSAEIEFEMQEL